MVLPEEGGPRITVEVFDFEVKELELGFDESVLFSTDLIIAIIAVASTIVVMIVYDNS